MLGSLLFLIHVNDLLEDSESYLNMFVGDDKLMSQVRSIRECNVSQRNIDDIQ